MYCHLSLLVRIREKTWKYNGKLEKKLNQKYKFRWSRVDTYNCFFNSNIWILSAAKGMISIVWCINRKDYCGQSNINRIFCVKRFLCNPVIWKRYFICGDGIFFHVLRTYDIKSESARNWFLTKVSFGRHKCFIVK